jgi:hypothetical protein
MPASLLKFVRLPDFEHPLAWLALVAVALWTATSTEPVTLTVLYGVLFATGWRATAQGSLRKPGLADAAMLVFALVLALRTATSAMPSQALLLGAGYLLYPAAYLVGRLTRTPEPRALLQGFIVPVLLVLVAWVAHDVATQVNVYGPFADSNSLAALMAGLGYDMGDWVADIGYRALYLHQINNAPTDPATDSYYEIDNNWIHELRGTVRYRIE